MPLRRFISTARGGVGLPLLLGGALALGAAGCAEIHADAVTGLKQIAHVDCPPRRFSGRALPTAVRAMAPGEHGPWVLVDGQVFQVLHDQLKADSRTSRMSVRRMVSDRNGGAWLDCLDGSLAHLPPKGPLRRFGLALHGGLAANLVAAADGSVWIDNHRFKPNRSNEL